MRMKWKRKLLSGITFRALVEARFGLGSEMAERMAQVSARILHTCSEESSSLYLHFGNCHLSRNTHKISQDTF